MSVFTIQKFRSRSKWLHRTDRSPLLFYVLFTFFSIEPCFLTRFNHSPRIVPFSFAVWVLLIDRMTDDGKHFYLQILSVSHQYFMLDGADDASTSSYTFGSPFIHSSYTSSHHIIPFQQILQSASFRLLHSSKHTHTHIHTQDIHCMTWLFNEYALLTCLSLY